MHKLSHRIGQEWLPHSYAPSYRLATTPSGSRIVSVAPGGDAMAFEQLIGSTEPPYTLLYVLHTPRGEGAAGRYVGPDLGRDELKSFILRFRTYLQADARFDLWAYSAADESTVVWDRHNLLFAYGNLDVFANQLRALGFVEGDVTVPSPHQHHYREEFDSDAAAILGALPWQYTELEPEDQQ